MPRKNVMPRKKETALDWARYNQGCKQALAWLRRQGPIPMTEAYRRCPNVAWMWYALYLTVRTVRVYGHSSRLTDARKIQLAAAMEAFYVEFWSVNTRRTRDIPTISDADKFLDKRQLRYWADRLREYITPR